MHNVKGTTLFKLNPLKSTWNIDFSQGGVILELAKDIEGQFWGVLISEPYEGKMDPTSAFINSLKQDPEECFQYMKVAADAGDPQANLLVALAYEQGPGGPAKQPVNLNLAR